MADPVTLMRAGVTVGGAQRVAATGVAIAALSHCGITGGAAGRAPQRVVQRLAAGVAFTAGGRWLMHVHATERINCCRSGSSGGAYTASAT